MQKLRKEWSEMTMQQKARVVAKDAILQIKSRKFQPAHFYLIMDFKSDVEITEDCKLDVKENLDKFKCQGCAKGALFLSHVERFNKEKVEVSHSNTWCFPSVNVISEPDVNNKIYSRMKGIFTKLNLDMIECAYEKRVVNDRDRKLGSSEEKKETELAKSCIKFGKAYRSDKQRMLAILENIAKYGEFRP